MSVLDIVLIIIGFILVAISYYITEKVSDEKSDDNSPAVTEVWGEKEEGTIKERVKNIVSDKSEEMIETVEDRLCHLSNDKIMEFKEYSDQVMESIRQEHKQAVFLYNMLNEKEESTKKLLNELDVKYAGVSDKIYKLNEKAEQAKNANNDVVSSNTEKKAQVIQQTKTPEVKHAVKNNQESVIKVTDKQKQTVAKKNDNSAKKEKAGPDRNDKILHLWKQGKSVLEISRLLGIGQGEVKLVIDLFKGV